LPKLPRMTAPEAEAMLFEAGFQLIRSSGSHRIYLKSGKRIVIPFHPGKILHPKIFKQLLKSLEDEK
jgi:predicted RNA binding protein YcfA (HicA-like mRNA interferase family)